MLIKIMLIKTLAYLLPFTHTSITFYEEPYLPQNFPNLLSLTGAKVIERSDLCITFKVGKMYVFL